MKSLPIEWFAEGGHLAARDLAGQQLACWPPGHPLLAAGTAVMLNHHLFASQAVLAALISVVPKPGSHAGLAGPRSLLRA